MAIKEKKFKTEEFHKSWRLNPQYGYNYMALYKLFSNKLLLIRFVPEILILLCIEKQAPPVKR